MIQLSCWCPIFIGRLLRALVCLRQTAHSVTLTTACMRHVHSAENKFRWHEYRSALSVDCWSIRSGMYPDAMTWACAVRMKTRFVLLICKLSRCIISCRNLVWWAPWDLPILVTGLGGVCPTISVKNLGDVIQNYHLYPGQYYVLKYLRSLRMRFETKLCPV